MHLSNLAQMLMYKIQIQDNFLQSSAFQIEKDGMSIKSYNLLKIQVWKTEFYSFKLKLNHEHIWKILYIILPIIFVHINISKSYF